MFALSTDAALRSWAVGNVGSGVVAAFYDAMNHGTNFLLLTEPIPGTDLIPDDPYELFLGLIDKEKGALRLTEEIAQV